MTEQLKIIRELLVKESGDDDITAGIGTEDIWFNQKNIRASVFRLPYPYKKRSLVLFQAVTDDNRFEDQVHYRIEGADSELLQARTRCVPEDLKRILGSILEYNCIALARDRLIIKRKEVIYRCQTSNYQIVLDVSQPGLHGIVRMEN